MHPYQHVFLHRGPSRVFWFLFGAGAATWWHYSSIMRDHRAQYFPCVMHRRRVEDPATDTSPRDDASLKPTWGPDQPRSTGWSQQRDWEQDRDRLRQLQKRAGETVADLSESTLDSIVAGAESLKAKLVALRVENERLEAEKKSPPLVA